jgi:hypothetical protein
MPLRIIAFGAHPDDCELKAGESPPSGRRPATTSSLSRRPMGMSATLQWAVVSLPSVGRPRSGAAPRF